MADTKTFLICIGILMLDALLCTFYLQSMNDFYATASSTDVDFDIGQWYGPQNYTVTQDFKQLTTPDVNLKNIWGSWNMDASNGLYPASLPYTVHSVNLFDSYNGYLARCNFGTVRLVNNTFTEKYYLTNINRNDKDFVSVLMLYQGTSITTGSEEIRLVLKGNKIFIQRDTLELGVVVWSSVVDKGFTLPAGVTSGNLSYQAKAVNDGVTDPLTGELASNVNGVYDFYVYWNDQLAFTVSYLELVQSASSNIQRQADIITNIGAPNDAYTLNVLSHYEDVHIAQISQDTSGYNVALQFVATLIKVIAWPLPTGVPIPTWLLGLLIGLPELGVAYTLVSLLRGGG